MDGSVRQASDEGRKGPHEALFLTPPRRPRSPRRDPIVDRRAAAAAHHSPRAPGTGAGRRRPAARRGEWCKVLVPIAMDATRCM